MTKYLIINSDDFGISEGVSRGIIEAHQKGILTSTTTMVNMPAAEAAIKLAQETAPNLGLGLHFVMSFGKPVSDPQDVPSLVTAEGTFVSSWQELMEKMPEFTKEDLERELYAQFERFQQLAGHLPDHLDSHHGVTYHHPVAFEIMVKIATEHNLPIRWSEQLDGRYGFDDENVKQLKDILEKYGKPVTCNKLVDFIFDFERSKRIERLQNGLRTIEDGYTELVVHVGYGEGLNEAYNIQREDELEAVLHPSMKQIIEEEGIVLCNFVDLTKNL